MTKAQNITESGNLIIDWDPNSSQKFDNDVSGLKTGSSLLTDSNV